MIVKDLGVAEYRPVEEAMRDFTLSRREDTEDELWLVEHHPVFTLGANGNPAHALNLHAIPLVETDRGGQITYHGPGQLVAYPLIDLRRQKMGVREMVSRLEKTVIAILADEGLEAYARKDAPGVYINERKIAALGLRVKRGACYHGVSFNIDMNLLPFSYINPCGYAGMEVIDLATLGIRLTMDEAKQRFVSAFKTQMQSSNEL